MKFLAYFHLPQAAVLLGKRPPEQDLFNFFKQPSENCWKSKLIRLACPSSALKLQFHSLLYGNPPVSMNLLPVPLCCDHTRYFHTGDKNIYLHMQTSCSTVFLKVFKACFRVSLTSLVLCMFLGALKSLISLESSTDIILTGSLQIPWKENGPHC